MCLGADGPSIDFFPRGCGRRHRRPPKTRPVPLARRQLNRFEFRFCLFRAAAIALGSVMKITLEMSLASENSDVATR